MTSPLTPSSRNRSARVTACVAAWLLGACTPLPTTPRNAPLLIADQPGSGAAQPAKPLPERGIQFDQNDYSTRDKYALDQRRPADGGAQPGRPAGNYATK